VEERLPGKCKALSSVPTTEKKKKAGGVAQVVEHMFSKCKALMLAR
jgi:hypothetical protein